MATRATTAKDGAAWAASQRYAARTCETCRWGVRHREGIRFINGALEAKRRGGAMFAFPALAAEAKRLYGYPFGDALRLHYRRGCRS